MGQQNTMTLKIAVQGTGADKTSVWVNRTVQKSTQSHTAHLAFRKQVSSTTPSTVAYTGPITSGLLIHLKASAKFKIVLNTKTFIASHFLIDDMSGLLSLKIGRAVASVTVEMLLSGRK